MSFFQYNRFSLSTVSSHGSVFWCLYSFELDIAHIGWFRKQLCNKNHVQEFIFEEIDSLSLQGVIKNGLLQIFPCIMLPKIHIPQINSLYKYPDLILNTDQLVLLSLQLELKQNKYRNYSLNRRTSQLTFNCSKSTIETIEKGLK